MFRLVAFMGVIAAILHYTGYLDYGKVKDRLNGGDKTVGDFYQKSPSDEKSFMSKIKDSLSSSSSNDELAEKPRPVPPPSKPVFSEGESNPRKMILLTDKQIESFSFYPDSDISSYYRKKK